MVAKRGKPIGCRISNERSNWRFGDLEVRAQLQQNENSVQSITERTMTDVGDKLGAPKIVDRKTFQAELGALRVREKAHA